MSWPCWPEVCTRHTSFTVLKTVLKHCLYYVIPMLKNFQILPVVCQLFIQVFKPHLLLQPIVTNFFLLLFVCLKSHHFFPSLRLNSSLHVLYTPLTVTPLEESLQPHSIGQLSAVYFSQTNSNFSLSVV